MFVVFAESGELLMLVEIGSVVMTESQCGLLLADSGGTIVVGCLLSGSR